MDDLILVRNIQNNVDVDNSIKQLTSLHSGIFFQKCHDYIHSGMAGIFKDDILRDKELVVYNAAKSFDESKGVKFSTWLGNSTFYFLSKLNLETKNQLAPIVEEEPEDLDLKEELIQNIFEYLRENEDEITYRIFELRYLAPTNASLYSWNNIGEKLGYSHEWVRMLHNKALTRAKHYFKNNKAA